MNIPPSPDASTDPAAGQTYPSAEDSSPRASRYGWAVVGMLWFICFFNYADRQAIFSIFPVLKTEFGFNKEQLGQIGTAFTIVYALTAPLAGQVGDRFSRKALILGGLYVWSIITGFTALCSKVWHFVLVRGAEGLGETFYFPASMSFISDYHGKETRSRAMSLHQTSVYAGTIGGSVLAGWLAQKYHWWVPFVVLAVAGIVLGLVLSAFLREPQRQAVRESATAADAAPLPMSVFLRGLYRTPSALLLIAAFFGANGVALVFLSWMPTFLKEKFQLDLATAGFGATFFIQTASMVGAAGSGVLADRWRQYHSGGRMLVQAVGALLGAPFIFACGYTTNLWYLVGAMTCFGFCKGLYDANIWAALYDVVPASRRGAAVGLMNMIGWIGGALGVYIIGYVANRGVSMSVSISSAAVIYVGVAALLLLAALRYAPRDTVRNMA
jgi:MFS family permease